MIRSSRLLATLAALLMVLAACGSGDDAATDDPEPEETEEEVEEVEEEEESEESEEPEEPEEAEQTDADHGFEDGDTVTLVLGSPPGGGFDTQARLLAPQMERAFDEVAGLNVNVVVENRDGGRHRVANEYVWEAEPDGRTIFHTSLQLAVGNQLLQDANYELREMTPLGSAGNSQRSIVVRSDLDLSEPTLLGLAEASQEQSILFNHPGLDADVALLELVLAEEGVELNLDIVPAQTADGMASMLRGEVDAMFTTTAGMAPFVEDNPDDLVWLVNMGCEREEAYPDVESVTEQDVPAADELCASIGGDDRPFLGPPGMPDATKDLLEEVLRVASEYPEYVEDAQSAGLVTGFQGSGDVEQLIVTIIETYEGFIDQLPTG
jgi:tripartite-type tricarboxylate transporter receptor subunit TctC